MTIHRPDIQEQTIIIKERRRRFTLGIPVGRWPHYPPTLLTPEGAHLLDSRDIEVCVEKGVGEIINYTDSRYAAAGANIVSRRDTLQCDVVLYPGQLTAKEASLMKHRAVLLTLMRNRDIDIETAGIMLSKSITVIALDYVRDFHGKRPLADILGEVSGRAAITIASSYLSTAAGGKGILLGGVAGVNPCEVVILGTGMSALAAARSAIGLGSIVRLFDNDQYCLRTAISELGAAVIGSTLHPAVLSHALISADIIIATRLNQSFAFDNVMIDNLKQGAVIMDLNDRKGHSAVFPTLRCLDVSKSFQEVDIVSSRVCFINPGNAVPRTAAMAATNDIVPVFDRLFRSGAGLMNVFKTDSGLRGAVMMFGARIVHPHAAEILGVKCVDISLLLSFS